MIVRTTYYVHGLAAGRIVGPAAVDFPDEITQVLQRVNGWSQNSRNLWHLSWHTQACAPIVARWQGNLSC